MSGSILALKILMDVNMTAFLENEDNKIIKNQRNTVSSSYPPRSLSDTNLSPEGLFYRPSGFLFCDITVTLFYVCYHLI